MAAGILLPALLCCLRQEGGVSKRPVLLCVLLFDSPTLRAFCQEGLGDDPTRLLIVWMRKLRPRGGSDTPRSISLEKLGLPPSCCDSQDRLVPPCRAPWPGVAAAVGRGARHTCLGIWALLLTGDLGQVNQSV